MRDGSTLAHTQWRLGITIAQIARRWRARLDQRIAEYGLTEARHRRAICAMVMPMRHWVWARVEPSRMGRD